MTNSKKPKANKAIATQQPLVERSITPEFKPVEPKGTDRALLILLKYMDARIDQIDDDLRQVSSSLDRRIAHVEKRLKGKQQ